MSATLVRVQELARRGELRISAHGYEELAADGLPMSQSMLSGVSLLVQIHQVFL
jgi:hypothetical protein